mgnify:CR=1 FL=1
MNALEKLKAMRAAQNNVVAANDDYPISHTVVDLKPTVKVCRECEFFQPDKINPPQGLGRCQLDINRKNKPLYPLQDACEKSKPLT